MDYGKKSIQEHKKKLGKFAVKSKFLIANKNDLSIAYTPGVGEVSSLIARQPKQALELTSKQNMVAVVSDGSAVLGLGNIGPLAAMPVMEGKAILFKQFADIDAVPIVLATQNDEEIIQTVKMIAPTFGGVNLEDIAAPRCFYIEERLSKELDIPVFHDDQHGTAIVVLAALYNSLKIVRKKIAEIKIVVNGAGAAGTAVSKLILEAGGKNIIILDTKGAISLKRSDLNEQKKKLSKLTNPHKETGLLKDVIKSADVFIGVSAPNVLTAGMIKSMNSGAVIFALANPTPEIMPETALQAGAAIVATGRSDFPNQINNVLVFPGVFRGLLNKRISKVTTKMKLQAALALSKVVRQPTKEKILPSPFDPKVVKAISKAIN